MKRLFAYLLCILTVIVAFPVSAFAGEEPTVVFDISTVTEGDAVSQLITPTRDVDQTVAISYDGTKNRYCLNTKESTVGLPCVYLNIGGQIDTTQDHWFRGKTLEYEVEMTDILSASNNPLFELSVYSEGNADGLTTLVNGDYGPALWWYPVRGICSTNEYPLNAQFSVMNFLRVPVNEANIGVTRRFKILENTSGMFHYYWDETADNWVLLASFAADDLLYCKGTPYIRMRNGDIYGIKSMKIYETPATDQPVHMEPGNSEIEPTYESDSKYLISQETFRKANNVACYFKGLAQANGGTAWGGGPSNTVVSYDQTKDMLVFDTKENTGINGVVLTIPGFDSDRENCFSGYTIEFEIVLEDICNVSQLPLMEIGPYYGNFGNCNNGTAVWWYPIDGRFKAANYNGTANHSAYDGEMKAEEGAAQKFRIVQDEDNIYFYRYINDNWLIFNLFDVSELHYNSGSIWFAFRNGDVYGIRDFAVYQTPEEGSDIPSGGDTDTTDSETGDNKPIVTDRPNVTKDETSADTKTPVPGKKGCISHIAVQAWIGLLAVTAVMSLIPGKKAKDTV